MNNTIIEMEKTFIVAVTTGSYIQIKKEIIGTNAIVKEKTSGLKNCPVTLLD